MRKNFHVMRYVLLASLAISDLLFLILVNSFRIASIAQERWLYGDKMCYLNAFLSRHFYINTVLHLMAVSYDRYDSIVKSPLTYNGTLTKCRVAVIALIWLIPMGFSIGPFLKWGEYVYNPEVFFCQQGWMLQSGASGRATAIALTFFLVLFLVIALLNWTVYKTAQRQANAIVIQIGRLGGSESHLQENSRRRRTERKAALEVSIIIAVFCCAISLPGSWAFVYGSSKSLLFYLRDYWSRLVSWRSVPYATRSFIPSAKETSERRLRVCSYAGGLHLKVN